jgi:hypothetical protein
VPGFVAMIGGGRHGAGASGCIEGPIGTGACDADHHGCFVIVNNASSTDPKDSVRIDISFAR